MTKNKYLKKELFGDYLNLTNWIQLVLLIILFTFVLIELNIEEFLIRLNVDL